MEGIVLWKLIAKSLEILSPLLGVILTWLSVRMTQWIQMRVRNEALQGALLRLEDAVTSGVRSVEQNVVASLKAATEDGTLSAEDRETVKRVALETILKLLGTQGVAETSRALRLTTEELNASIETRIEAAVYDLRGGKKRVLNGVH